MALPVPYLDQHRDIGDPRRRESACSVTCLAMALRFLNPSDAPSPDALYDEGEAIGARDEKGNWTHAGIAHLARNHGLHAYSEEFRSMTRGRQNVYSGMFIENGLLKIREEVLSGRPVIVSVFGRRTRGPHTVLVVGIADEEFIIHDPDAPAGENGKEKHLSIEDFRENWRGMAIFFDVLSR